MTVDRRHFVKSAAVTGAALAVGNPSPSGGQPTSLSAPRAFRLRYAPHFGMFRQHAGQDFVAELEFMAAEGFTALEDNDMKGRTIAEQERSPPR